MEVDLRTEHPVCGLRPEASSRRQYGLHGNCICGASPRIVRKEPSTGHGATVAGCTTAGFSRLYIQYAAVGVKDRVPDTVVRQPVPTLWFTRKHNAAWSVKVAGLAKSKVRSYPYHGPCYDTTEAWSGSQRPVDRIPASTTHSKRAMAPNTHPAKVKIRASRGT